MNTSTLKFLLLGEDRSATKTLRGVGKEADKTKGSLGKIGGGIKAGIVGAIAAIGITEVLDFANTAVEANRDAEKSQRALEDAYKRFPATADVSIGKLRELNQALQDKNGADADDLAAGQAVLARYKLTGSQIAAMTPLLADYAKRTGKDIPASSGILGKAMMGNARAMKELGIRFKDTGDPAKNYDQIMKGLRKTVGGYADKEAASAAGKTDIMRARMGDLQESIGGKLEPVMSRLIDTGMRVLDWLDANPGAIRGAAAAFDGFVGVVEFLANAIGFVLKPALVMGAKTLAFFAEMAAKVLDALGNVPGFEWAKGAAQNLRGMAEGAKAAAEGIDDIGRKPPTVDTTKAQSSVKALKESMGGIKDKIVKAEAKGDTKTVDRLKKKLGELKKQYDITLKLKKAGISSIRIVPTAGGVTMKAYRQGGRPRVGELAMFHRDELWVPDQSGTVISQARSRSMMGDGPAGLGGGGDTVAVYVSGDTDPDAAARRIAAKLERWKRKGGRLGFL